jgi:hypothetical protein
MLVTITRLDKMATLRRSFAHQGMLQGTTALYTALSLSEGAVSLGDEAPGVLDVDNADPETLSVEEQETDPECRQRDVGPSSGPRLASSVMLARRPGEFVSLPVWLLLNQASEWYYPRTLPELAAYLEEPQFESAFINHLYEIRHPNRIPPPDIHNYLEFTGRIHVFHSAVARFYAPSDACGAGGMQRQVVRCNPGWHNHARMDTVLGSEGDKPEMGGMTVAQLRLLFSFTEPSSGKTHACALVNWFPTVGSVPDPKTGMWKVRREVVDGSRPLQVISLGTIVRGAHLLPVFGEGRLPEGFCFTDALEAFREYFLNHFSDNHCHELLSM